MNAEQKFSAMSFDQKTRLFARGRRTVSRMHAPPDLKFAPRWFPKVAGHFVSMKDMPEFGYLNYADALNAATRYRDLCRDRETGI